MINLIHVYIILTVEKVHNKFRGVWKVTVDNSLLACVVTELAELVAA